MCVKAQGAPKVLRGSEARRALGDLGSLKPLRALGMLIGGKWLWDLRNPTGLKRLKGLQRAP